MVARHSTGKSSIQRLIPPPHDLFSCFSWVLFQNRNALSLARRRRRRRRRRGDKALSISHRCSESLVCVCVCVFLKHTNKKLKNKSADSGGVFIIRESANKRLRIIFLSGDRYFQCLRFICCTYTCPPPARSFRRKSFTPSRGVLRVRYLAGTEIQKPRPCGESPASSRRICIPSARARAIEQASRKTRK